MSAASIVRPWSLDAAEIVRAEGSDATVGLSAEEAAARLAANGPNELTERERKPRWQLFASQFANTMIVVLALAAGVTALIGELKDTIVIAAIVVINGVVGFVQEYRAERTMAALRRMTADEARVMRGGRDLRLPARELVRGDLVVLSAGDVVPADLRLLRVHALRVNEAVLTGEAEPVTKTTEPLTTGGALVGDRHCIAFRGTAVTYGRGTGVVVATGMDTELGQIAALLQAHGELPTPLQRRLAVLGRRMAAAAVGVCAAVFVVGVARGEEVDRMFVTAVSLAVAAIPEGLPAVVTVALALGAHRMAEVRALVRKLPAVETLGSVTVICSDKTGTLTENRMLVERVWTPSGCYDVGGSGYEPAGPITGSSDPSRDAALLRAAHVAAACNDAAIHPPDHAGGSWRMTGDPTEGALLAFAGKLDVDRATLVRQRPRRAEIAFDSTRRRMTTLHDGDEGSWVAVKGALDALAPLLARSDRGVLGEAEEVATEWAAGGYRVMALADRTVAAAGGLTPDLETDLHLAAVVAIADPPRPGVEDAVRSCRAAGVMPVMITGDHRLTAASISRRLGILTPGGTMLTGEELDALDDAAFGQMVGGVQVYARTTPEQKLRIVEAWKGRGAVVAMTGDGVNDAPALRRADIGVAMGVIGTDVSKEAADMVLADDNFATVVRAVEEGRRIYDNVRRFVRYLLTTNSGEVWVMFLAPLLGLPVPLTAVQILWVNLMTDGLPAIALGLEPVDEEAMRRPPRAPTESIFAGGLWQHAVWVGLLMAAVVLPIQVLARSLDWHWPTMVFTTLALLQLGHALAVRSEHRSLRALGLGSNPWLLAAVALTVAAQLAIVFVPFLRPFFGTESLGVTELAVVLTASTIVFAAVEIEKLFRRRSLSGHAVDEGGDCGSGACG